MIAVGLDLGGTKIEAQIFDANWRMLDRSRVATPTDYDGLVAAIAAQIRWAQDSAGSTLPVGVSAAGLINAETGLALTANLPATGRPLPADIARAAGRPVTFVNDCRAFTLSEAIFGAAKGERAVAGLILGTGSGGGFAFDGVLLRGGAGIGGEFGHSYAPAHLVVAHGLPIMRCGCGREGCIETLVSGPGLSRIAKALTGKTLTPPEIAQGKADDAGLAKVWSVWCALVAEMVMNLTLLAAPQIVVLGGGLSRIEGVIGDLQGALSAAALGDFPVPRLVLAEGGDASGARGAAFAAWQAAGGGDV